MRGSLPQVELWTHDRARFPLPPRHRFPLAKYPLLRRRVVELGLARPEEIHECEPVTWALLERVHDHGLLHRIRHGELSLREQRGLGLPWSPELVERGRRSVAGTLAAARHALASGVAMNLGGGTHHAGRDFARGYCLFNDVACTLAELRAGGVAHQALVVDCDVHQGDGTADLLAGDPDAFTLSLHGARNYPFQRIPSDLDVDLATGTADADYLAALDRSLDEALARSEPEIAFYLAGADPWEGDRLGRLSLTKAGLRARDELVIDRVRAAGAPVCVVLAGRLRRGRAGHGRDQRRHRRGRRRPPWRRGESNPYLSLAKAACSRYHYAPGGASRIDARLGCGDGIQAEGRRRRRDLELRHRQPLVRPRGRPDGPARRRRAPSCAPPTARCRCRSRSRSPTGRSTSSRASASSTTARAGPTRAASATTPRSTSTRCARSPR